MDSCAGSRGARRCYCILTYMYPSGGDQLGPRARRCQHPVSGLACIAPQLCFTLHHHQHARGTCAAKERRRPSSQLPKLPRVSINHQTRLHRCPDPNTNLACSHRSQYLPNQESLSWQKRAYPSPHTRLLGMKRLDPHHLDPPRRLLPERASPFLARLGAVEQQPAGV